MANIGGKHTQAWSRRRLTYWCAYEVVENELVYVAAINEGPDHLGQHEATLRYDPSGIPAKDLVRMDLLRHIDRTRFGEGRSPDPRWIGWYGPFL